MNLLEYLEKIEENQDFINIVDMKEIKLSEVDKVEEKEFSTDEGKSYKRVILHLKDGKQVISPISVMKQLKVLIENTKGLQAFKVVKSGSGLQTTYSIIPTEVVK